MQNENDPNIPSERQSFLTLTRDLATLPLEQSAAALETGAAIATVSLRASIEFLRAAPETTEVLEPAELRAWGELGRRLTMAGSTWVRPDGIPIVAQPSDLLSGRLLAPITVRAEQEGRSPKDITDHFHAEFLESWKNLGISFDLFTRTGTENHREVVHQLWLKMMDEGHITTDTMLAPYCAFDKRFLPDRYVEGTCPNCGFERARGVGGASEIS